MRLHLLTVVALIAPSLVLAATSVSASPPISRQDAARTETTMNVTRFFSPNGDGRRDVALVSYTLTRATTKVTLTITRRSDSKIVRTVRLGDQGAGPHGWRWDGRDGRGRQARDDTYLLKLGGVVAGHAKQLTVRATTLDTSIHISITRDSSTVYPRSSVVRDVVTLSAGTNERRPARIGLVVQDAQGEVVLRRKPRTLDVSSFGIGETLDVTWDALTRAGEALPPGKYVATSRGRDNAGNRGKETVVVLVSGRRLVWSTESRTVVPADVNHGECSLSTANGCGEVPTECGSVAPSSRFAGGLSHRSAICAGDFPYDVARSFNWLTFPEAKVRGIESARVSFTGAPTYDGEQDEGSVSLRGVGGANTVSSSSGVTTGWVSGLQFGDVTRFYGSYNYLPPLVDWTFSTYGDDAFDAASYTVEARYLSIA